MSETRKIPLTQGKVAIVDADMYDELAQYKWYFEKGYAVRWGQADNGRRPRVWMHRVVNQTPDGMETDHIDGDKLNNTRANLRSATRTQNMHNAQAYGASRFRGVHFNQSSNKWQARIRSHGKRTHLGTFVSEEDAARAYDAAAVEMHGPFARLNFEAQEEAL